MRKTLKLSLLIILYYVNIGLCSNPVIISDETFLDSDWEAIKIHDNTPQQDATFQAYQVSSGGNPEAYRYVSHTWTGDGAGSKQIAVAHIYTPSLYNPSEQGPISTIDCSFDAIFIEYVNPYAVAYYPIIRQDGSYYKYNYRNVVAQTWQTFSFLEIGAFDWVRLYPDSGPEHPDFSELGAPIYFGYATYNGTSGNHTLTTESGIDNYLVEIYRHCDCDLIGDINQDCSVTELDLEEMAKQWLAEEQVGINDGLVGYWNFDEGEGNTALDNSGNDNDGTVYGASYVDGISGTALSFDGEDDYVEIQDDTSLHIGENSFSLCAWVNEFSRASDAQDSILSKRDNNLNDGWLFSIAGTGQPGITESGKIFFQAYNNEYPWIQSDVELNVQQWFCIVLTYDTENNEATFYRNGIIDSVQTIVPVGSGELLNIFIGKDSLNGYFFHGLIDEVRIYNRALSENEIRYLYYAPSGLGNYPADINSDGIVDMKDFAILAAHWLEMSEEC